MSKITWTATLRMPCCDQVYQVEAYHQEWPGTRETPPEEESDLDFPFDDEGEPFCRNCQHVFTDRELEALFASAWAQLPPEPYDPLEDDSLYMDPLDLRPDDYNTWEERQLDQEQWGDTEEDDREAD